MILKYKKLSLDARAPTRADEHAAGYDLYSAEDIVLPSSKHLLIRTDIALEIPEGYYGRIAGRSGLAYKNGIDVYGGVLDSSFRGAVGVILYNSIDDKSIGSFINTTGYFTIRKGDRIAQLIIEKYYAPELIEVSELSETNRGEKGFGSTGK